MTLMTLMTQELPTFVVPGRFYPDVWPRRTPENPHARCDDDPAFRPSANLATWGVCFLAVRRSLAAMRNGA
jgi:hypothetical protein